MKKRILITSLLVLAIFSGCATSNKNIKNTKINKNTEKKRELTSTERFESLSKLTQVIGTIEKYHHDNLRLDELVEITIIGLMNELGEENFYIKDNSVAIKFANAIHTFFNHNKFFDNTPIEKSIIDDDILYIKIPFLYKGISKNLEDIIKSESKINGLILDLRNNPGGYFFEAVKIADLFLGSGEIVKIKSKASDDEEIYNAKSEKLNLSIPLIILVNESTISGAEIISGALKNHKKAILIGSKTYGYASMTAILPLDADRREHISIKIAEYVLSNNTSFNKKGIIPDIVIKSDIKEKDKQLDEALKYLNKRLSN